MTATYGAITNPLVGDGRGFFYLATPVTPMPTKVTVTATQSGNLESSLVADVADIVNVSEATYDPDLKTLTVAANPACPTRLTHRPSAVLKVEPFGVTIPVGMKAQISGIAVPPAHVKVSSSYKGSELKIVNITNSSPAAPAAPDSTPAPQPVESLPVTSPDTGNDPDQHQCRRQMRWPTTATRTA